MINIISHELRFDKKINFYQPYEFEHIGKFPNGDGGLSGTSLALAIILPIVGVIIIAVVVLFICKKKESITTSDEIEKLTANV